MSDLLEDEIRFLVAEIVNAASKSVEAPRSTRSHPHDFESPDKADGDGSKGRFVVFAALIALLFGIAGLVVFGGNDHQPVITDTPSTTSTTSMPLPGAAEAESLANDGRPAFLEQARREAVEPLWTVDGLEIFRRDRVAGDDEFPVGVLERLAQAPFPERFGELDPSRARRALSTADRTIWVVPSEDNRAFCDFVVTGDGSGASCTSHHDGFQLPVLVGTGGSSGTGSTRTGYRATMVLNESIVRVEGIPVVNNWTLVEFHGDEVPDAHEWRDAFDAQFQFTDGTEMTVGQYSELFDDACSDLKAAFFSGGETVKRQYLERFIDNARHLRQAVFDEVIIAIELLMANSEGSLPLSLQWREAVRDTGRICFQSEPKERHVAIVSDQEPHDLTIDDSSYATATDPTIVPTTGGIDGPPLVVFRDGECRYAQLDPEVWEGDQLELGCDSDRYIAPLRFAQGPEEYRDYVLQLVVAEAPADAAFAVLNGRELLWVVDGLVALLHRTGDFEISFFDAGGEPL